MATRVVWLQQAKDDLREILAFIAASSPRAAGAYAVELQSACKRLEEFPLSGRRYNETFRVLVFRNHLVFHWYDETTDVVSIAAVLDGRRDLKGLFDRPPK